MFIIYVIRSKMIRILSLLCFVATSSLAFYAPSLKVRFDLSPFAIGTESFIELPRNSTSAASSGWVQKTRPDGPEGLTSLELWCPKDDNSVCLLFDDTGYVAGLQIAFNKEFISNAEYDWTAQGFTEWTTTLNDTTKNYYTVQLYFVSKDTLAKDPATRTASRNSSLLIQDGSLWVSGINGEQFEISTKASDITGEGSLYTKQQCIPGMGYHYYYKITPSSDCAVEHMFPWFPLIYNDQLIGIGFNVFMQYNIESGQMNWFEYSGETSMRLTVPRGPECLYEIAGRVGQVSLHIYFIENPYEVFCLA